MQLDKFIDTHVHAYACEPKGMEAHNNELDVTERQKQFQKKGPEEAKWFPNGEGNIEDGEPGSDWSEEEL